MLGLPDLRRLPRGLTRQLRSLHAFLHPWSDELSYRAFAAVSLLSHAIADPAADLVLDVGRLDRSMPYRESVRVRLLADVGLSIDFDECQVPSHDMASMTVDFAAVERDVRERLIFCGADLATIRSGPCAGDPRPTHPVKARPRNCMRNA